jgi:hypothetical protein
MEYGKNIGTIGGVMIVIFVVEYLKAIWDWALLG